MRLSLFLCVWLVVQTVSAQELTQTAKELLAQDAGLVVPVDFGLVLDVVSESLYTSLFNAYGFLLAVFFVWYTWDSIKNPMSSHGRPYKKNVRRKALTDSQLKYRANKEMKKWADAKGVSVAKLRSDSGLKALFWEDYRLGRNYDVSPVESLDRFLSSRLESDYRRGRTWEI